MIPRVRGTRPESLLERIERWGRTIEDCFDILDPWKLKGWVPVQCSVNEKHTRVANSGIWTPIEFLKATALSIERRNAECT